MTRKRLEPIAIAALATLAVLAISACGEKQEPEIIGGGGAASVSPEGGDGATKTIPGDADPADVRVIDGWVRTLARGDVEGAARYFAIPSVAENGPALVRIEDRDDARLFNASLPCGASLIRAVAEGDFVVATFRLSERPGPGTCGDGTGGTAQTAFVITDGEIAEWRRVGIGGEQAPSSSA